MPRATILLALCELMTPRSTPLAAQPTRSTIVLFGTGTPRAIRERAGKVVVGHDLDVY